MSNQTENYTASPKAIGGDELDALFSWLEPYFPLVLAVSGGADSMCLMHLMADWLKRRGAQGAHGGQGENEARLAGAGEAQPTSSPTRFTAVSTPGPVQISNALKVQTVTVDHGLRAGSVAEAQFVQRASLTLGFAHTTLRWDGDKPQTGIQAAARKARYELISAFLCKQIGQSRENQPDNKLSAQDGARDGSVAGRCAYSLPTLLTAHHQDDLAETVLMRLARGSGLDGLAGMSRKSTLCGMTILRPLLELPKTRLVATLNKRSISYVEDPSNENTAFERVRLRRAASALSEAGLGNEALAVSARRLARAKCALDELTSDLMQRCAVRAREFGYGELVFYEFNAAPEELRLRLLNRLIGFYGGADMPVRLSKLEDLCLALGTADFSGATLNKCRIVHRGKKLMLFRETGRAATTARTLEPGASFLWDHRFLVSLSPQSDQAFEILPLGENGWRDLKLNYEAVAQCDVPFDAASSVPAFWARGKLVAVPVFGGLAEDLSGPRVAGAPLLACSVRAL